MADVIGTGVYGAGIYGADLISTPNPTPDPVPVPDGPADPDWVPTDPGLSIIGTNGDVILIRLTDEDFTALQGSSGIGIPPKVLTIFEGAADGGTVRYTRTGVRDIDLVVGIFGATRGEVGERQRRLSSALRVRKNNPPARLRFTLETGEVYETVVYYVSGAETSIGDTGTAQFSKWQLTLQAPDPYWTSTAQTSFTVGNAGAGTRGLLPNLTRLQLTSSQVLGSVLINNPGDVESDVRWEITGPGGPFVATCSTGERFTIRDVLGPGEQRIIDTKTATVVDETGANQYSGLGPAPKLFKLPDGKSTVLITLDGATDASSVIGRFYARREVVY
jgi:hypothetical protein